MKSTQIEDLLFIGTKSHVAAIHKVTGVEIWRCKLKGGLSSGSGFVTLLVKERQVFAHTGGELFCLDAASGRIVWQNALTGMGYGLASIAMDGISASPAMVQQVNDEARKNSSHAHTS